MVRFTHRWSDSDFRVFLAPPKGSQQIVVGDNGRPGGDGKDGLLGDAHSPPGSGGTGGSGGSGEDATADGSKLKFAKADPLGTWLESAAGGNGGHGGDGGNAGSFPHGIEYGQPWADGGSGGTGAGGGQGFASIDLATIWGRTGTANGDGISLTMNANGGSGGHGGTGGFGDGAHNSPNAGGDGGDGGSGGGGGDAFVQLNNTTFDQKSNAADRNHFTVTVTQTAIGGNGGAGSNGGKAGLGTPKGLEGDGGDGGSAGEGSTDLRNTTFNLAHTGGGTSVLTVIMTSQGGDGADGGLPGRPSGTPGDGGQGGSAGITFYDNLISGGAENDTVRLAFSAIGGAGGASGDGKEHALNGDDGTELNACVFVGGGGHDALFFSWSGHSTNHSVSVDLNASSVGMGGGVSTINGFLDITGGSAADFMVGNDGKNALNGSGGDDELRGMADADTLTGGGGHDHFIFIAADESSGPTYDTITDLNLDQDKIGVDFDVAHVDDAIGGATIRKASFDADIDNAVGELKSHHAVLVTAKHGTLQDHTFLVIVGEGVKGYQPGHDVVIDVTAVTGTLNLNDFFNAH